MTNFLVRLVDRIGEITVTGTEKAVKKAQESALIFKEHDESAKRLIKKEKDLAKEKRRELEEQLFELEDTIDLEVESNTEKLIMEREELEVPFQTRFVNFVSELFSSYSKTPISLFSDVQDDLYRANIMMPASKYIAFIIGLSIILGATSGILAALVIGTYLGALGGVLGFSMGFILGAFVFFYGRIYPKSKIKGRSDSFSRELPYALRHLATQLTSGAGLLDTMKSVSLSNYGVLSEEFRKAILEVERGATIEEAFERMNLRIESPGLKRATRQIISTIRTGGNLADTLKIIAEEVATEMRMKLKDFIQVLNTFSLMYMFIVVIGPVLVTTLVIAMGIASKKLPVPAPTMWLVYITFFGISIYMSFMVKRFEPKM